MARVTLQTIADALGVSRTTVSNAFSRPDQLTEDLRQRILDTARDLGYAGPDPAARTLRRGRAGAVGLVFTEALPFAFADPYAIGFLQGFAEAVQEAQVGLLLVPAPPGQPAETTVGAAVVDALCVYSMPDGHPAVQVARRRRLPLVLVDEPFDPDTAFVGIDDRAATAGLARHVLAQGHSALGVLSIRVADDDVEGRVDAARLARATFRITRDRIGGILDEVAGAGMRPEQVPIYESALDSRAGGREMAGALLDARPRPTAVLALTDQLALAVLDAAADRGLSVPGDLSVTGFDDIPDAAAAGLTTVRQPITGKGREAGRLLMRVTDGAPAEHLRLSTEVVVRRSTGPAPS